VIIAYDLAALEQGEGTNALYADGRVEWLVPEVFKKALEESRKKAILQNAQP
jgi:prepilin-type processing-associated H-X9-DG protein